MSVLANFTALRTKINLYIKTNLQQLITGEVLNNILQDVTDTADVRFTAIETGKLDKSSIGFDPATGINLRAGSTFKVDGVDIIASVINGGGPAGPFDASAGLVPASGSGAAGAILNGNFWRVAVAGTIPGLLPEPVLSIGDIVVSSKNNAAAAADFYSIPGDQEIAQLLTRLSIAEGKLLTIENGATADQTRDEIRNLLESLAGDARMDSGAIKNIMQAPYVNATYPDLNTIKKAIDYSLQIHDVSINTAGFTGNLMGLNINTLQKLADYIDKMNISPVRFTADRTDITADQTNITADQN